MKKNVKVIKILSPNGDRLHIHRYDKISFITIEYYTWKTEKYSAAENYDLKLAFEIHKEEVHKLIEFLTED